MQLFLKLQINSNFVVQKKLIQKIIFGNLKSKKSKQKRKTKSEGRVAFTKDKKIIA